MDNCQIVLDNYQGRYFTGDVIEGQVITFLEDEHSLTAVKVRIWGKEVVNIEGAKEKGKYDNVFFKHDIPLYENANGSNNLSEGLQVFSFSYIIPENLPTSFTGINGYVRYKAEAVIEKPIQRHFKDTVEFFIIHAMDVNKIDENLKRESNYSQVKQITCLCCASGIITMDIKLSQKLVLPGETITFDIRLNNSSKVEVLGLKITFIQKIKLAVEKGVKNTDEVVTITETTDVGTAAYSQKLYKLQLDIPELVLFPNFDQCVLFNVKHYYLIHVMLPKRYTDMIVKIRAIVGNIRTIDSPPSEFENSPDPSALSEEFNDTPE